MKVVIIEDEQAAVANLTSIIQTIDPNIEIIEVIDTVEESIEYFKNKTSASLIFMDIHLADGISFDIFKEIQIEIPIIFTTAYDEYAIKAFKVNSIDYILKPIDEDALKIAIDKFKKQSAKETSITGLESIIQQIYTEKKQYKTTYLVQQRDNILPIKVSQIAYFYIDTGTVKAINIDGEAYIIDKKLEEIEEELNPSIFFRANRQYIIQRDAIKNIQIYFNGKLIINSIPKSKEQIIVSKVKAPVLKQWLSKS